jgi:import receptor subunit TOM70
VFYANRAACYANLSKFKETIDDCNASLKVDKRYAKALHRRGQAYEKLGELREALNGMSSTTDDMW